MDYPTQNLTRLKAMGLAGYATHSIATGNLYNASSALEEATNLVAELIANGDGNTPKSV